MLLAAMPEQETGFITTLPSMSRPLLTAPNTTAVLERVNRLRLLEQARPFHFAPKLANILDIAERYDMEGAIDRLFDLVDGWLISGDFRSCNQILTIPAELFPITLGVSLIALTKPIADRLPARVSFLDQLREHIRKDGRDCRQVLGALDR